MKALQRALQSGGRQIVEGAGRAQSAGQASSVNTQQLGIGEQLFASLHPRAEKNALIKVEFGGKLNTN